jgi:hypothetical protein
LLPLLFFQLVLSVLVVVHLKLLRLLQVIQELGLLVQLTLPLRLKHLLINLPWLHQCLILQVIHIEPLE